MLLNRKVLTATLSRSFLRWDAIHTHSLTLYLLINIAIPDNRRVQLVGVDYRPTNCLCRIKDTACLVWYAALPIGLHQKHPLSIYSLNLILRFPFISFPFFNVHTKNLSVETRSDITSRSHAKSA